MSQDVRLTAIEKSLKKITTWLPGALLICTLMGAAMTVQSLWDSNSSKIDKLSLQIDTLIKQNDVIRRQQINNTIKFEAYKATDSTGHLNQSKRLDSIVNVIRYHRQRLGSGTQFVTEIKPSGPNSKPTLVPVN